jgi:hypothetical protein
MTSVSNGKLCGGVNANVGYRYTVNFPTCEETQFDFKVPTDFGKGGAVNIYGNFILGSNKDNR